MLVYFALWIAGIFVAIVAGVVLVFSVLSIIDAVRTHRIKKVLNLIQMKKSFKQ